MVETIQALEARGHAYRSDGSVYFRIASLADYGKLARLDHAGMQDGARIDSDEYAKDAARDFVLWKATGPDEPTWDYGVGPGRPGWHIECSAMALRLLDGSPIDIHAGGVDLVFPHHENEIAQSEGSTGEQFARFWVHVEHLLLGSDVKMSKSLGNVLNVRDVLDRGYRASALRYVLLSTHYRKQLRFGWDNLAQAEEALRRLMDCLGRLDAVTAAGAHEAIGERAQAAGDAFRTRIADDLNTPGAIGVMFELVRDVNTAIDAGDLGAADVAAVREAFDRFDDVLGVIALRRREEAAPPVDVIEIERLIEERRAARRQRTSLPRTVSATSWTPVESCWRIRRRARAGNGSSSAGRIRSAIRRFPAGRLLRRDPAASLAGLLHLLRPSCRLRIRNVSGDRVKIWRAASCAAAGTRFSRAGSGPAMEKSTSSPGTATCWCSSRSRLARPGVSAGRSGP